MTNLWPEEESLASKLGSVFDEAFKPHRTGDEIIDEILQAAAAARAAGKVIPEVVLRLERQQAIGVLMSGHSACAEDWLQKRKPLKEGEINQFVEHWRTCATCQAG